MRSPALRVLLIEDDARDAELLVRHLKKAGLDTDVTRVETPEELNVALESSWDVVISDYTLPRLSAPSALEAVRAQHGDMLPFIIVSGAIGEEVAVTAMQAGANDYLLKDRLGRLGAVVLRETREARARVEQQRIREELATAERLATVGMLAAGIAHEINNPVASIVANIDYLTGVVARLSDLVRDLETAQGPSPAPAWNEIRVGLTELAEPLEDIGEACGRVRHIISDLRTFTRAPVEQHCATNAHTVLDASIRLARSEISARTRVERTYAAAVLVDASPQRLGQVFLNLLVNASQAVAGQPDGLISVQTSETDNGWLRVEVRDNGPGLAEEVRKRLFAPFVTTKAPGDGTGMGLAICRRVVVELGGRLDLVNAADTGVVATVCLPPAQRRPPTPLSHAAPPPESPSGTVRMLLVDDDRALLRAMGRTLDGEYELTLCDDPRSAVDLLAGGNPFDVIVCDLMMPGLDGSEFYDQVLALRPELASRVVFMSGGALSERLVAFPSEVGRPMLGKPFELRELRVAVAAACAPT